MRIDEYKCSSGGDRAIRCECTAQNGKWGQGSCTCGSFTFAFDCANACTISPEDYQTCGLTAPPPDNGGGESSSSSSGGS
jgi:hypothetical protein